MRIWILLACGLMSVAVASAASTASRFTERLTDSQRRACGIDLLSGDQVASLNALVHRDAAALLDSGSASPAKPFSQRLFPDEFHSAGLDRLTAAQLGQLDVLVGANLSHPGATAFLAAAPTAASPMAPLASGIAPPEIHGMISLTYGGGGGMSLREATTALDYVDPTHRLEIGVSYSDVQLGGKSPYARAIPPP